MAAVFNLGLWVKVLVLELGLTIQLDWCSGLVHLEPPTETYPGWFGGQGRAGLGWGEVKVGQIELGAAALHGNRLVSPNQLG